jgi:hypothetical protein
MKKLLTVAAVVIFLAITLVVTLRVYKFNSVVNYNIPAKTVEQSNSSHLNYKDATYTVDGQSITLKSGISEITGATSSAKIITRYFGNEATGDLNGDNEDDVAFILTQENGGSGTFYYLAVALDNGSGYKGLNTALLGDRIAPQTIEINKGEIIVNYADRKEGEPMSASPSVGVSKNFQVVMDQVKEINNIVQTTDTVTGNSTSTIDATQTIGTTQMANPASVNCATQGGNLVIQKRGDGGEYGLCYFEENRACEEWALLRGDCPLGGRKTTGFDTIDQNYCAWLGGETFAMPQSVCTLKNGVKCPTIELYNGTCLPTKS